MEMNVVFRLNSVEELKDLARALEETSTLQAKMRLEEDLKRLTIEKNILTEEIDKLRKERREIEPSSVEKVDGMTESLPEAGSEPSSFEAEIERVLESVDTSTPEEGPR